MFEKRIKIYFIILILNFCSNGLEKSKDELNLRLLYFSVSNRGLNSFTVQWACSSESRGVLGYGISDINNYQFSLTTSRIHTITVRGLQEDQNYSYTTSCDGKNTATSPINLVKTLKSPPSMQEIYNRGIWILGGIGPSGVLASQVDLYDPIEDRWYPSITSIPTPRLNAGIVSNSGKIYVIGGLIKEITQSLVEEYNPSTNTWRTMSSMPVTLQSFLVSSVGTDIFILGGTTSNDMVTGTLPPFNVYRFSPNNSPLGNWTSIVSSTALVARIDMGGCALDGMFYFTGGRYYLDGSAYSNTDAYITSGNTTTTQNEIAITSARHGMASICYRPLPSDPFPNDTKSILLVGGNTLTNLLTPITAITASNVFNYYTPLNNTIQSSPIFPIQVYGSAGEVSYLKRRVYIFGGSSVINIPLDSVYSLYLETPTSGPWTLETTKMPIPRFGHKAVILSR
jgi:hypothetical protein